MTAIISIGNEILLGKTLNTNLQFLATRLAGLGLPVDLALTIKDDPTAIREALERCWEESEIVISTGGLGPTDDDITKASIAEFFGVGMRFDVQVWERVQEMFARRGLPTPEINRNQALVPEGFEALSNERGTAPGLYYESGDKVFFALPGVPLEMEHIFDTHIARIIRNKYRRPPVIQRNIHTFGISESLLAERLRDLQIPKGLELAWLPQTGRVDLRLYGGDVSLIDGKLAEIIQRVPEVVWGVDEDIPAGVLGNLLRSRGIKVAFAESCTGGLAQKMLTDQSGSSDYFLGGVVSYSNSLKQSFLGVSEECLEHHGAVSSETAEAMADGIRNRSGAEIGVSITGIAGPEGGSPEKPVGTVWFGFALPERTFTEKQVFSGDRAGIRHKAAEYAILRLVKELRGIKV